MKTLRLFFLTLLVTSGILASAAPLIAATQVGPHPQAIHVLDGNPTPTPTPHQGDPPDDCMSTGC